MITIKLNLLNFKVSVKKIKAQSGELDCIVIPIDLNNLYRGESGIYLDLVAFEIKNKKEGMKDTHIIKQSLPKEVRMQMSEDEQKSMPIIGNMNLSFGGSESAPVSNPNVQDEDDDLPF